MMKMCQNCQTENPADAVFCSQCGMSLLARAATGKESEVQDTTDPTAKRLRRIARVLAVIWAVCWTLMWTQVVWFLASMSVPYEDATLESWGWFWLFPVLVAWVPTAVAWRWEAIGGIALLGAVLLLFSLWFGWADWLQNTVVGDSLYLMALLVVQDVGRLLFLAGPPLAAGSLLLASWRRSKSAQTSPDSE